MIGRDQIRSAIAAQAGCREAEIGDDDDLIQLGLNSIAMMALAGSWRKEGVQITFAELAATPTVASWHGLLAGSEMHPGPGGAEPTGSVEMAAEDVPFALAPMQHAYWIGRSDEQRLGGVAAHLYVEFDGCSVDPARLRRAVAELVDAHPMLRTRFLPDGTQQTLPEPGRPVFEVADLRGRPAATVRAALEELRDRKTHQRLDITAGQVIDVTLTRWDDDRTRLHLDVDMLAADAMSYRVLVSDLAELYRGEAPPAFDYSYRRYRTERGDGRDDSAGREYDRRWWRQRLDDMPGAPELPTLTNGDPAAAHRTARYRHWLDPGAGRRLITGAHARGVTPAMAVAAVFADTVGGWSARSRFLLNVPLFHREPVHPDINRVVGDFTSSVLLDIDVTEEMTVTERAREVQRRMYEAAAHSSYSGLDVLRDLGRRRDEPVLAPIVFTSALDLGELFAAGVADTFGAPVWIVSQGPQVLLDAQVSELHGGLLLNWDVREASFPPGLVDAMFTRFIDTIDRLAGGADGWDADAAVRLPPGQARVRAAVNATDRQVSGRCLHQGFFENAAATPDAPALLWGVGENGGCWSYAELAERALAVAGALRDRGVGRGDAVAVQLPKGRNQIPAVLGILAVGAVYVPVGFDQPVARRARILRIADVAAMLTVDGAQISTEIPCLSVEVACRHPAPLGEPVLADPDEVGYLMFTSGSTGAPKGVEGLHRGAMNTIDALNVRFGVTGSDRALGLSALEFDVSIYDIFGMFSAGGALVTIDSTGPGQPPAADTWVELIRRHRVSILNCVPSMLDMILAAGGRRLGDSLRTVILGGDWVDARLARRLAEQVEGCRFAGLGGATETSIHSTVCEVVGQPPPHWSTVPFGVPLANVRCRVVAPSGRDCPDWVPGELWIGGAGVAAGYRNDPERTAERFVGCDGVRWYRTGDLARYTPDGSIEFLGRADTQVQLRGYRVELGEVENALRAVPGVRQAVAVVVGAGAPKLVAAVAGAPDRAVGSETIGAAAAELLPDYMIPSRIEVLGTMPLTPNGKLDRRAVARLLEAGPAGAEDDDAPDSDLEAALAAIVGEVLGLDSVGAHRDFFALGGDSVLATAVIARVRDWLDVDHAVVADLFATRTVAGLAQRLQARDAQRGDPDRLVVIARAYLEVAAMTDEEVLAES